MIYLLRRTSDRSAQDFLEGQANKSTWRMPWHQEPKKDVISCDKLRGAANKHRAADFRMGKPGRAILCQPMVNKIVIGRETR